MKKLIVRKDVIPFYLLIIFFSILSSLRGATSDTYNYKYVYDNIEYFFYNPSLFFEKTAMEIGFGWLAYIVSYLGFNFQVFLFIYSFFIFYFIGLAAKNLKINRIYVLLCYIPAFYFFHQWMQIRQGLAVAIVFYFVSLTILNKNFIKQFVFFILSISFHNIVFPFLLLINNYIGKVIEKIKINYYLKFFLLFILVILMCRFVSMYGVSYIDRIAGYASLEEERGLLHPANLRSYLLLVVFLIFRAKAKSELLDFLIILFGVGVGCRIGFYDFLILSGRLSTTLTFSEIFIIPMIVNSLFGKYLSYFLLLIYFLITLYITIEFQLPDIISQYFLPLS